MLMIEPPSILMKKRLLAPVLRKHSTLPLQDKGWEYLLIAAAWKKKLQLFKYINPEDLVMTIQNYIFQSFTFQTFSF